MPEYDIVAALQSMEEELILSMKRNLQRHLKEEADEGFEWTQWQAEKLNSIARYRAQNAKIIGEYTSTIPDKIDEMIQTSYVSGKNQEEIRILEALKSGYTASMGAAGEIGTEFFTVNERKLNALITATQGEMRKATSSILRYQEDIYRKTIFRAASQYNMGGKTLWQAVDAATHDFLAAGIHNIRYKDGRQVNIASYVEMALRTANLRANIQGEAAKRDEWGICTVKMSSHGSACPKCILWQGKVYYDDVFGSIEVPKGGKYPLLSTAIEGGALHPNCKNGVSTWFEGINKLPEEMTKEEIEEANRRYDLEQKQRYYERNVRKYKRLSMGSLDPENAAKYAAKEKKWRDRLKMLVKDNPDVLRMDYARLKLYDVSTESVKENTIKTSGMTKKKITVQQSVFNGSSSGNSVEVSIPAPATNGGKGKTYQPEKIPGKALTSGEKGSILNDISSGIKVKTRYFDGELKYYDITQERIQNVPLVEINGLTKQQEKSLADSCKKLLEYMQGSETGTEGVLVLNINLEEIERYKGAPGNPRVPLKKYSQPYFVLHNHPDGLPFSEGDLLQFIRHENMIGLAAVGNDGTLYFLYKTKDYDADVFDEYVNSIRMNHLVKMTPEDHICFSEEVIANAEENGVTVFNGKDKKTNPAI